MSKFNKLRADLDNNGWVITNLELATENSWALEIWQLVSCWNPVGNTLYLSLMLDPMDRPHNKPDTENDVWGIELSRDKRRGLTDQIEYEVGVSRKFEQRCNEIVQAANSLRNSENCDHLD